MAVDITALVRVLAFFAWSAWQLARLFHTNEATLPDHPCMFQARANKTFAQLCHCLADKQMPLIQQPQNQAGLSHLP